MPIKNLSSIKFLSFSIGVSCLLSPLKFIIYLLGSFFFFYYFLYLFNFVYFTLTTAIIFICLNLISCLIFLSFLYLSVSFLDFSVHLSFSHVSGYVCRSLSTFHYWLQSYLFLFAFASCTSIPSSVVTILLSFLSPSRSVNSLVPDCMNVPVLIVSKHLLN